MSLALPTLGQVLAGAPCVGTDGQSVPLTVPAAARLLTAIDDDLPGGDPHPIDLPLLVEEAFEEYGEPLVILRTSGLRYLVQAQEELRPVVQRLCVRHGCRNEALSYKAHLTTVCLDHLDVLTDLIESDDPATVRTARLDEWTRITTEARSQLDGDLRHAESLRKTD